MATKKKTPVKVKAKPVVKAKAVKKVAAKKIVAKKVAAKPAAAKKVAPKPKPQPPTPVVNQKTGTTGGPTAAQRELMMLYILMGKDQVTYNPATTTLSGADLVAKMATDYQTQTGSTWNWDALTPAKAGQFAQGAIGNRNKGAFKTVAAQFQAAAVDPMAWPGGGGTHPDAGEVGTALSVG